MLGLTAFLVMSVSAPANPLAVLQPQFKSSIIVQAQGQWIAPAGVTSAMVECVGSGGLVPVTNGATNGGGGGAYSASVVTVKPGVRYGIEPTANKAQPPFPFPLGLGGVRKGMGAAFIDDKGVTLVYAEGGESTGLGGKAVRGIGSFTFDGGDGGITDQTTWPRGGWTACGEGGFPGSPAGPGANGGSTGVKGKRVGNGAYRQICDPFAVPPPGMKFAPPINLQPLAPAFDQGAGGDYAGSGTIINSGGGMWVRISW
jgi:hypothetical protein